MARVRGKDTSPELKVRDLVGSLRVRYGVHASDLPGCPDLVFRRRRKVIFVHGCFWHRHPAKTCALARMPKSRLDFWQPKLEGNRRRDLRNRRALVREGWSVMIVWECQIGDLERLKHRIRSFLDA